MAGKALTGLEVYRSLMDLDLLLSEISEMGPLRMFLDTVSPGEPALVKLHTEILAFTQRIQKLADASKRK